LRAGSGGVGSTKKSKVIAAARAGSLSPMTIAQAESFSKTLKYEEAYR